MVFTPLGMIPTRCLLPAGANEGVLFSSRSTVDNSHVTSSKLVLFGHKWERKPKNTLHAIITCRDADK